MNKLKSLVTSLSKIDLLLVISVGIGAYLRFANLGYSDYQGDEIRAQYIPMQGEGFVNFLLRQRKGPFQFLVTYITSFFDPSFRNYFYDRLPFAFAAVLGLFFFYKFIELVFNKKVAFFATMFMSINGFFVALSRILQYQGFVFLFCTITLYLFAQLAKNPKKTIYLYSGMFVWGLSMLTHYDGMFIAPAVGYFLWIWFFSLKDESVKKKLGKIALSGILPATLIILFYGALVLSITKETRDYWAGRLTGTTSSKSASSLFLFRVYQPFAVLETYVTLFVLSILLAVPNVFKVMSKLSNMKSKGLSKLGNLSENILKFKPFTYLSLTQHSGPFIMLFVWLAFPLFFMEELVAIPGTHIYTYLMPLFVIMGFVLAWLTNKLSFKKVPYYLCLTILGLFFTFAFVQSQRIFVENTKEYPWENEKFLFWEFQVPDISKYHLSLFGFPYYRNWQSIQDFTRRFPHIKAYTSNENNSISNYYMRMEKDTTKAGFYVYVSHPQTFKDTTNNEKYLYWSSKYDPIFTISRSGNSLVNIYLMEPGEVSALKEAGF